MSIVVYKCPICDRTIDIVRNEQGLETVGRCIITDGCRGQLYQLSVKQDFSRGQFPSAVAGLTDWSQREILYNHIQSVEDSVWLITHNLGVNPSVQVHVDRPSGDTTVLVEVEPDSIVIISENVLQVNLSRDESGIAQCIGRSSRPVIKNVRVEEETTTITPFQLSGNSEISIATLDSSTNNTFVFTFVTPDGRTIDLTYIVDDVPSIVSPGSTTDKVFFHGKSYTVRSFSGIDQVLITNGSVSDSSSFYIKTVDVGSGARPMLAEEVIFLLADSPYAETDRIDDRFIDPTVIGADEATFSFFYENGEFYAYDNLIETVFPNIRSI